LESRGKAKRFYTQQTPTQQKALWGGSWKLWGVKTIGRGRRRVARRTKKTTTEMLSVSQDNDKRETGRPKNIRQDTSVFERNVGEGSYGLSIVWGKRR